MLVVLKAGFCVGRIVVHWFQGKASRGGRRGDRKATGIFAPMYNTPAYAEKESVEKKVFEIDSDVLRHLSDFSKGESPTDRQPGSSILVGPRTSS